MLHVLFEVKCLSCQLAVDVNSLLNNVNSLLNNQDRITICDHFFWVLMA